MTGKHKSRREGGFDYFPLFQRIEEAFDPSGMDDVALKEYLNASTPGMIALTEQLSQTREISIQIEESEEINELRLLKKGVNKLDVHKGTLLERIEERIISIGITTTEEFAKERKIRLTERVRGNIEVWADGKQRIVIRKNGVFVSWRLV